MDKGYILFLINREFQLEKKKNDSVSFLVWMGSWEGK